MQTLLIDCPDQKGLVYQVMKVLFQADSNVTKNEEYVDQSTGHFFMRTVFEEAEKSEQILAQLRKVLPAQANIRLETKRNKNIVVMATREHHCIGDLLLRYAHDELQANILAVVSNHRHLQSLVAKFGIPFHFVSHKDFPSRAAHEEAILRTLDLYQPEYVVLAKYMRVLNPEFVQHFPERLINIHHSFLPAFIGAKPYKQAFDRGVKIIGATAHFVNEDLDQGPIIAQDIVRVDHRFSAADMAKAGRDVEKIVFARALKLVFENRVFIHGNKTVVF